jgi:hypothetical protein
MMNNIRILDYSLYQKYIQNTSDLNPLQLFSDVFSEIIQLVTSSV